MVNSSVDGCACIQLEWLTGGECLAGMHEVVVTKRTLEAIELARQQNRSLWRVSSTVCTTICLLSWLNFVWELNSHLFPPSFCCSWVAWLITFSSHCIGPCVALRTYCFWCNATATRPFCRGIPCKQVPSHLCWRFCWTGACSDQSQRQERILVG